MRERSSNSCPFVEILLQAMSGGDTASLSMLFGDTGSKRLLNLYGSLNVRQKQMFGILLPSAVVRELQSRSDNQNAGTRIASAIGKTLREARSTDYDSVVIHNMIGTIGGAEQTCQFGDL